MPSTSCWAGLWANAGPGPSRPATHAIVKIRAVRNISDSLYMRILPPPFDDDQRWLSLSTFSQHRRVPGAGVCMQTAATPAGTRPARRRSWQSGSVAGVGLVQQRSDTQAVQPLAVRAHLIGTANPVSDRRYPALGVVVAHGRGGADGGRIRLGAAMGLGRIDKTTAVRHGRQQALLGQPALAHDKHVGRRRRIHLVQDGARCAQAGHVVLHAACNAGKTFGRRIHGLAVNLDMDAMHAQGRAFGNVAADAAHPQDEAGAVTTGARTHMGGRITFFQQMGDPDSLHQVTARGVQENRPRKTPVVVGMPYKLDDLRVVAFLDAALDQHALAVGHDIGRPHRRRGIKQHTGKKGKSDS
eukprot:Amastigsp_a5190_11.p1 type:complete len:356 gc:universal Amastigsp_a5190_11:1114-47(-)